MPVSERAARKKELDELIKQYETEVQRLNDEDWIERLASSSDWQKLGKIYRETEEQLRTTVEGIKEKLVSEALTDEQVSKLRQTGLVMRRDLENTEAFLSFPRREMERLKEVRRSLPVWEARIKELKEQLGEREEINA